MSLEANIFDPIMIKSLIFFLILLSSCGKSLKDDGEESIAGVRTVDGSYRAFLGPVNRRISSSITGEAKVFKYGDDFRVASKIQDAPEKKFVQYLHTGSYCPNLEDDQNGDGYLDRFEFINKAGPVILPLDGDLSSQDRGRSFILRGNYQYQRSTSYYLMLFDLHLPDELLNDEIVKLKEEDLQLDKKVIAVYLRNSSNLPLESSREVPIACGILGHEAAETSRDDDWDREGRDEGEVESPMRRPRNPSRSSPVPRPRPPNPEDEQYERPSGSSSWWDRLRQRWRRWRNGGGASVGLRRNFGYLKV